MKIKFIFFVILFASNIVWADQNEQKLEEQIAKLNNVFEYSLKEGKPIYAWSHQDIYVQYPVYKDKEGKPLVIPLNNSVLNWAAKKNANYLKQIFDIESYMITQQKNYYWDLYYRDKEAVQNIPMLNRMGDSSQHGCQFLPSLHPLYFLKYHSPQESKVLVDIGSGWGTCAKLMAHLGYKVYSVDLDEKHLEYQREHFCDIPDKDSFLNIFWQRNNPELLKADNFLHHCQKAQNNITYIQGDFADASTVSKLKDQKWDIVIATYSTHFMNDKQRNNVWNSIKNHLKSGGSFVLTMTHTGKMCSNQASIFNPVVCDFSLEEVYEQYFDRYKILTLWLDDQQKLGGYTLKKP